MKMKGDTLHQMIVEWVKTYRQDELSMLFNNKLTENGDTTHVGTGNRIVDLLFQAEYYQRNLDEVRLCEGLFEKLFAMFIRDPRFGLGYRDLGRVLMRNANLSAEQVVFAGRYDDLWKHPLRVELRQDWLEYLFEQCRNGNDLAKKWMPHYSSKLKNGKPSDSTIMSSKFRNMLGLTKQQYGKFVKCETVESLLSSKQNDLIDFEKLPTLSIIKYWARFKGISKSGKKEMAERFKQYLDLVRKGKAKMNFTTATVYDIYRNSDKIDADLAFSKLEKIKGNWIPIVDTSSSMFIEDSIGKAMSIGHYLSKCSTYAPNRVITFSNKPKLIELGVTKPNNDNLKWIPDNLFKQGDSVYSKEISSMYTGDWSNTNFSAVMEILSELKSEFPEYIIVLSDMAFDDGAQKSNIKVMEKWRKDGIPTKLVWWNLNKCERMSTVSIRTDDNGSIFISGYSPNLLQFLESSFDGEAFIAKLLTEYASHIPYGLLK